MPAFYTIIHQRLSVLDNSVSRRHLKRFLQAYAVLPVFLCITDAVDEMGIDYATDLEQL